VPLNAIGAELPVRLYGRSMKSHVDLIIIIIITIKVPTITNISVIIHDRIIKHVDRVGCSMLIVIE